MRVVRSLVPLARGVTEKRIITPPLPGVKWCSVQAQTTSMRTFSVGSRVSLAAHVVVTPPKAATWCNPLQYGAVLDVNVVHARLLSRPRQPRWVVKTTTSFPSRFGPTHHSENLHLERHRYTLWQRGTGMKRAGHRRLSLAQSLTAVHCFSLLFRGVTCLSPSLPRAVLIAPGEHT